MASQAVGLDDTIATLMTMGFDLEDCQDAMNSGKLTVQAAVDWILGGKPKSSPSTQVQPTLNLSQPSGVSLGNTSNPFLEGNVASLTGPGETSSFSQHPDIDVTDSSTIVSRSHLSEKQQQIKHDFEEKERIAARKKAQDEKRKQKLDKERILKEIQADRDKVKLTKPTKTENTSASTSSSAEAQNAPSTSSSLADDKEEKEKTTIIQVRLPSGKVFRQSFQETAKLGNVWDAIFDMMKREMLLYQGFIQPFPRREFSREEMQQSLKDLGLTPSGSLVLKQKEPEQASEREVQECSNDQGQQPSQMEEQPAAIPEINPEDENMEYNNIEGEAAGEDYDYPMGQDGGHNWGRGFRVDDEDDPVNQMDFNQDAQAVGFNPFGGANEDNMFEGEDQPNEAFQGFGLRLVPEGVPADDGHHLQRRAGDMAAEAAAQRFARPQPVPEQQASRPQTELRYNTQSLQDLSLVALAKRITDPRMPLFSMVGISHELLQIFLTYLKKERLLSPRTLHLMPSYLLKLNLDSYPYTTNELLHSARVLVNMQHISMNSCPLITDAGLLSLKGMKVLKSLSLLNCSQITDVCFTAISALPSLQSLNLEGTKVTTGGVSGFASSGVCPQLSHINLNRTSVTHAVIPVLSKFQHLKSLCLKQNRISSLSGIESLCILESLDVSQTDIVSDSVLCVTQLPRLRHLCLTEAQQVNGDTALSYMQNMNLMSIALPCRTTTTDIGMSYISGFRLNALDLTNYTQVGDAGMLSVGQITSLKTLLLTNTRVTDEGMPHLAGLVNLEVLFVDKTLVSNAGVLVVQKFKQLNELSLSGTRITSDLLKQGVLNSSTMLSKLNLSRTAVGDRGLHCLKLPCLTLLNLDCTRAHEYVEQTIRKNCPSIKHVTLTNLSTVPEDEAVPMDR